jgi:enterochelin esterase-like enzyme
MWLGFATLMAMMVTAGCGSGEGQLFERTIPAPSLRGNLLGEPVEQDILVYLPPGYASGSESYPAVYFLPGYDTRVSALLDGTYQGFSLAVAMDQLIGRGTIEKMIVVVVNGRSVLGGSFFANSPVTGNWENFLVRDVVRYVDKNYKTIPFIEKRGIAGHSTGGTAALHIALRHPNLFSAVYSISPGLFDGEAEPLRTWFGKGPLVDSLIDKRDELAVLPREQAQASFMSYIDDLFESGTDINRERAFIFAYGAAYAPDPSANAPYVLFPVGNDADGLDTETMRSWRKGFGDIEERIHAYREKDHELEYIVLEAGTLEPDQWIIKGCKHVSTQLGSAGIPQQLVVYKGGHEDRLRERIEAHMLPFFSRVLVPEQ